MSKYEAHYELRCRECGRSWGNQPRSICDECFSPLEITYDYDFVRASLAQGASDKAKFIRERIAQRPPNMWRYAELLPLPAGFEPRLPVGFTPLFQAPRLAARLVGNKNDATTAAQNLYLKNDAVCLPTLSFKDRVVAVALAQAVSLRLDTVACSSTGNLANAVAAQAAREGLKAWIFIPSDLEPAKILGTQVFGANVVRITRQLRSGQSPVLADCRRAALGIREREPAALLCGRVEDGGIRNRRATGLALARQRGCARWPADR